MPNVQTSCPLALMRDTSKVTVLSGATTAFAKAQIQVYSTAGEGVLLFSVVISLLYAL
jgi:vacuolar protein sorting-associated protein 16